MLLRSDPFREFDRFVQEAFGTRMRPSVMPMDAHREGDHFVVTSTRRASTLRPST